MSAPAQPPQLETAIRCIEWSIQQITNANGYYLNGILTDRAKDPRAVVKDKPAEYELKQAAITINVASCVKDPKASIGARKRWRVTLNLMAMTTLTTDEDAANITLDMKVSRFQDDLWRAINENFSLSAAATALSLDKPNATALEIDGFVNGSMMTWPDAHFVAMGGFLLDVFSGTRP